MQSTKLHRIHFLWHYIRPWRFRIALGLLGLIFVSLTSLLYPWLLKLMVDQFGGHASSGPSIDVLSAILAFVFLASALAGYYEQVEMKAAGFRLRNAVRTALYRSLLSKPISFHRDGQVGELSSRATEDIGKLQLLFSGLLAPAFQNVLFISGCLLLMVKLNWLATVIVIALVAIPIPFVVIMSRRIRNLTRQSQTDHANANAFFEESLVAMREIKAFVREKWELQRYARSLDRAFHSEVRGSSLHAKTNQAVYMLISGALLAVFYVGTRRTFLPEWTLGDVIAFYFYSYTMTAAVLSVGKIYMSYQELSGALDRVADLLVDNQPKADLSVGLYANPSQGKVVFQHVSFSYDHARIVLKDISLTINPGTWQIITGPSGSGKSTMASLLMGFDRPDSGSICVDDIPLELWNIESLRSQIGYVGQDPVLFHGTLRENIAFSNVPVSDERVEWAIEQSCLRDVVESAPEGLNTVVGERGYTLSGGQKARVAVARAIILEPAILVLDEANAMLETELEQILWDNLARVRASRTTIIFSHHYQNIPRMDSVVQLRDGTLHSHNSRGQRERRSLRGHTILELSS